MISGKERYPCSYCNYVGISKSIIAIHERYHTGEKPFSCNYCEKSFTAKYQLRAHERVHTGEKPFSCTKCKASFSRKTYCREHEAVCIGRRKKKPFSCKICGKAFKGIYYTRIHEQRCGKQSVNTDPNAALYVNNVEANGASFYENLENVGYDQRNDDVGQQADSFIPSQNVQVVKECYFDRY